MVSRFARMVRYKLQRCMRRLKRAVANHVSHVLTQVWPLIQRNELFMEILEPVLHHRSYLEKCARRVFSGGWLRRRRVPHNPRKLFTTWSALYLIIGLWAVHVLHVCRFALVGWSEIAALPDWRISLRASLWFGLLLLPAASAVVALMRRYPELVLGVVAVVLSGGGQEAWAS